MGTNNKEAISLVNLLISNLAVLKYSHRPSNTNSDNKNQKYRNTKERINIITQFQSNKDELRTQIGETKWKEIEKVLKEKNASIWEEITIISEFIDVIENISNDEILRDKKELTKTTIANFVIQFVKTIIDDIQRNSNFDNTTEIKNEYDELNVFLRKNLKEEPINFILKKIKDLFPTYIQKFEEVVSKGGKHCKQREKYLCKYCVEDNLKNKKTTKIYRERSTQPHQRWKNTRQHKRKSKMRRTSLRKIHQKALQSKVVSRKQNNPNHFNITKRQGISGQTNTRRRKIRNKKKPKVCVNGLLSFVSHGKI